MNKHVKTTDDGYLIIQGNFQMEVYAEINQTWILKIGEFKLKFESTKQAMDFIHSFR
jgi:hypothetical protein